MKLYTGNLSPYSAKVRMQIYAMGITDIEFDLPVAEFFSGQFAKRSPIGRIPVLVVDEGVIPESEVIAEYLDELYPEKAMVGTTLKERADVRVISRIADVYLMNNIFMCLGQLKPDKRSEAVVELLMGQVKRGIGALENHLGDGDFAVGNTLTRADCTLVPALYMCQGSMPRLGVDNPIIGTTKVAAYWEKIQKNEFAAKIMAEMEKGMQDRLDGTEAKRVKEAIEQAKQQA
ncbi:MAG: glutathione S-transferase [Candidatus Azotimanducaceae bacterium]